MFTRTVKLLSNASSIMIKFIEIVTSGLVYFSLCLIQSNSESSRLADTGLHLLLASDSSRGDIAPSSTGLLASDNPCSVLLLPQIEDVLRSSLPQPVRRPVPATSSDPSTTLSTAQSASTCDDSVVAAKSIAVLQNCLGHLRVLVSCCRHARLAVVLGGCSSLPGKCDENQNKTSAAGCLVKIICLFSVVACSLLLIG